MLSGLPRARVTVSSGRCRCTLLFCSLSIKLHLLVVAVFRSLTGLSCCQSSLSCFCGLKYCSLFTCSFQRYYYTCRLASPARFTIYPAHFTASPTRCIYCGIYLLLHLASRFLSLPIFGSFLFHLRSFCFNSFRILCCFSSMQNK